MAELRWLLLLLGVVAVAAVYLYTRYKPRLERGMEALRKPIREPTLTRAAEAPEDDTEGSRQAVPAMGARLAPARRSPGESKIVTIRLMARERNGFPGEKLVLTMRELGLQHGQFGIFHCPAKSDDAGSEFSIASLVEPGSFDLTKIRSKSYPGVSIFMMLPGSRDGVEIFDDMMKTSRSLAHQLDGELLDEQGSSLSIQRERYLREEVIQFEHQGAS